MLRGSVWKKVCAARWSGIVSSRSRRVQPPSALDDHLSVSANEQIVIPERIRILVFHENAAATGLGRISLGFAKAARQPEPELPIVDVTFVTYRRNDQQTGF